mmetsp:Transcript_86572/g.220573  ORF Transcript_86572/g.220573 Transcript_86572/m.220573 type:complete len:302 (-) Transcript_86572:37-942(-)
MASSPSRRSRSWSINMWLRTSCAFRSFPNTCLTSKSAAIQELSTATLLSLWLPVAAPEEALASVVSSLSSFFCSTSPLADWFHKSSSSASSSRMEAQRRRPALPPPVLPMDASLAVPAGASGPPRFLPGKSGIKSQGMRSGIFCAAPPPPWPSGRNQTLRRPSGVTHTKHARPELLRSMTALPQAQAPVDESHRNDKVCSLPPRESVAISGPLRRGPASTKTACPSESVHSPASTAELGEGGPSHGGISPETSEPSAWPPRPFPLPFPRPRRALPLPPSPSSLISGCSSLVIAQQEGRDPT